VLLAVALGVTAGITAAKRIGRGDAVVEAFYREGS
jgi:hypothetical protein